MTGCDDDGSLAPIAEWAAVAVEAALSAMSAHRRTIEMAASMGIGHKVLFTGFLRGGDVEKVFKMADLYVMPSVSEPFGIASKLDVPVDFRVHPNAAPLKRLR